jgi:Secretion system C-terminal sorting domain
MLRNYILRIALLFMLFAGHSYALNAQCTNCHYNTQYGLNEVIICYNGGKSFNLSRSASLFNTVTFTTWGFVTSSDINKVFFIDFNDGLGFRQTNGSTSFTVTYPAPGTNPADNIKTIRVRKGATGDMVNDEIKFMIKKTSGNYISPDVVWKVETPNVFNPASLNLGITANAFPANGNQYMAVNKGVGHAYIKYAPSSGGKLKKPIIFVDGIDFDSESKNYYDPALGSGQTDANVIRHGVTGWDIFVTGTEDGFSKLVPNASEDFSQYPTVFQNLWDRGYDVIFLDFAEGATWIQKNAEVLKELIRKVNIEKSNNGSNAENAIVGPSMGGQVARIALAEMERDGEKHCTQVYLSFDSPHQGAHIPLGLQAMAWAAYDANLNCDRWISLNQPAARQLLTYHLANEMGTNRVQMKKVLVSPPANTGILPILVKSSREEEVNAGAANDGGIIRSSYVNYLKKVGYPKQTNNLAIADGNVSGDARRAMTIPNGVKLFDGNIHITNNASLLLNIWQGLPAAQLLGLTPKFTVSPSVVDKLNIGVEVGVLQVLNVSPTISTYNALNNLVPNSNKRLMDLKMYALPGTNSPEGTFNLHAGSGVFTQKDFLHLDFKPSLGNNTIFEMSLPTVAPSLDNPPIEYFKYHAKINSTALSALLNLDNVPGAGRSDLISIEDILVEAGKETPQFATSQINSTLQRRPLNFISTFSALDVQEPMTNANINAAIGNKKTPFEDWYGNNNAIRPNLNHVEVDVPMRNKVMEWIDLYSGDLVLGGSLNNEYNYGLRRKKIGNVSLGTGTTLSVNDNGATGFRNEAAAANSVFDVAVTGCGPSTINIEGGTFHIGSKATPVRSGNVYIENESVVNLNSGNIKLTNASVLYVKSGGKLNLNAGTVTLNQNATIVVEKGGILILKTNCSVILNQNGNIVIEKGGTLKLEGPSGTTNFIGNGPESAIVIKGALVTTTSIQLENTAFLRFEHTATISTTNPEFRVTGSGKTVKMMELMDNTQLKVLHKNLEFSSGKILYRNNTAVVLTPKSWINTTTYTNFTSVTFQGAYGAKNNCGLINGMAYKQILSTFSIVPTSPNAVSVLDCDFNDLNVGIHLIHEYLDDAPENFTVDYSNFNDYRTCGIVQKHGYQLLATNSTFHSEVGGGIFKRIKPNSDGVGILDNIELKYGEYPVAMDLKKFGLSRPVDITSCFFRGSSERRRDFDQQWDAENDFNNESIKQRELDDLHKNFVLFDRNYLIMLEDVNNFTFSGSTATEACAAIFSKSSNVELRRKSLISNSCIAIEVEGDAYNPIQNSGSYPTQKGRVTMDCAKMLNNAIGVYGINAWLNIDEIVASGGANVNTFDNYYTLFASGKGGTTRQTQGRYFEIHYPIALVGNMAAGQINSSYYSNGTIKATSNKWVEDPRQRDNYFISERYAPQGYIPFNQFTIDFNQNVTDVNECDEAPFGKNGTLSRSSLPEEAYGEVEYEGKNIRLGPIYWEAMAYYYQHNYEAAFAKFKEITAIPEAVRKASKNSFVYQYIDVARTMIGAEKENMPINRMIKPATSTMLIFPNPATENFKLVLPSGRYDVTLTDVLGRVIKQAQVPDYEEISVIDVQNGVYQVSVRKQGEQAVFQTGKIVINKD